MKGQTQQLKKLGEDWAAAELHGDAAFLEHTLADDFIAVGPRGFMLTKDQWLARHESQALRYESLQLDEVRVHAYGDAAVMTARETAEGRYEDQDVRHDIGNSSAQH